MSGSSFPVGLCTLLVNHHGILEPSDLVLEACFLLKAPFRGMLLTLRGGPKSLAPRAHRIPVYPMVFSTFLFRACTAHLHLNKADLNGGLRVFRMRFAGNQVKTSVFLLHTLHLPPSGLLVGDHCLHGHRLDLRIA